MQEISFNMVDIRVILWYNVFVQTVISCFPFDQFYSLS